MSPDAEDRALDRLRRGTGTFGLIWEAELPDEAVKRSMEYHWTLLGEHLRDLGHAFLDALRIGHRGR